ncbi:DDE superfamily endonuclease [Popillia japonica]|uniref:DDE superfamily endonuclease n=1 Tax=Popillia japonica TaxID=7064 RepID=A0AAW1HSC2_POPJA
MSLHNIADLVGMEEELTDDEDFIELLNIELRIPRVFRERINHFEKWNDNEFKQRFRLSKPVVKFVIDKIAGEISSKTLWVITDNFGRIERCVSEHWTAHIRIQSPGGQDAERYRNRKDFFSHNVRVVCDSDLLIRNIVCRWHGSAHDSTIFNNFSLKVKLENEEFGECSLVVGIFNNSSLKVKLENEEFGECSLVVGDSGYAVREYLITPLENPRTPAEHLFNESQIRTRNPVERCFGAWKCRFLALALGIRLHNSKVEAITVAAAVLHNVACMMNDAEPRVTNDEEAAVQLTININNDHVEAGNPNVTENNLSRHLLINGHFAGLL